MHQNVKSRIEEKRAEVDTLTLFGTRQSRLMYETHRLALHFEDKEEAAARTKKSNYDYLFFNLKVKALTINNFKEKY